jgi:hypothetical protein
VLVNYAKKEITMIINDNFRSVGNVVILTIGLSIIILLIILLVVLVILYEKYK